MITPQKINPQELIPGVACAAARQCRWCAPPHCDEFACNCGKAFWL